MLLLVIWIAMIPNRKRAEDSPIMPVYGMDFGELEDVQVRFEMYYPDSKPFLLSTNASRKLIKLLEEDAYINRGPGYKTASMLEGKFFIGDYVFYYRLATISEDFERDKRVWDLRWDYEARKFAAPKTERNSEEFYRLFLEYGLTGEVPEEFQDANDP